MKIALLADIHSNLEALQACLAHAEQEGAESFVFLGDLVGYGADPVACLALIAKYADQGALLVCGNHDEAALTGLAGNMNPIAREAIQWTRRQLGAKERAFLSALPMTARHGDLLFVHASANKPETWPYIYSGNQAKRCMDAGDAAICFVGHVHQQMLYWSPKPDPKPVPTGVQVFTPTPALSIPLAQDRRWLAIAGSVGQPRDGDNAAAYALFEDGKRLLTFFRVPYDHQTAARKIVAAGLPGQLAEQLLTGE
ncbi:MAG: metallophosphoesterase family protein [Proteobacteria bacterium]|nr:metallophosphoesterase family protein [Pseudomonadota bacterium]